jgi:hypothetical protein
MLKSSILFTFTLFLFLQSSAQGLHDYLRGYTYSLWPFDGRLSPEIPSDKINVSLPIKYANFSTDRFQQRNKALANAEMECETLDFFKDDELNSFTIGFWHQFVPQNNNKSTGFDSRLNRNLFYFEVKNKFVIDLNFSSGTWKITKVTRKGNKINYFRNCQSSSRPLINLYDGLWHFVLFSVNGDNLTLTFDNDQYNNYTTTTSLSKKELENGSSDGCGRLPLEGDDIENNKFKLSFNNSNVDDLFITKGLISDSLKIKIYNHRNWKELSKNQGKLINCDDARLTYQQWYYPQENETKKDINDPLGDPWVNYLEYGKEKGRTWPVCISDFSKAIFDSSKAIFKPIGQKILGDGKLLYDCNQWMVKSLDVTTFRNGDKIRYVSTPNEWKITNEKGIPCWTYADSSNGNFNKLYNYFAVSDSRGLAPEGYRITTKSDWDLISPLLYNTQINDSNYFYVGLSRVFDGFIDWKGNHIDLYKANYYWCTSKELMYKRKIDGSIDKEPADIAIIEFKHPKEIGYLESNLVGYMTNQENNYGKRSGMSVKCVVDKPISSQRSFVYSNGDTLVGDLSFTKSFNFNGYGFYKTENYIYEGKFMNSRMDGEGKLTFRNSGLILTGTWKDGMRDGIFTEIRDNKDTIRSFWENDNIIAREGDRFFNKIISVPPAIRGLFTLSYGTYLNSLKGGRYRGGSVGETDIYFEIANNDGFLTACKIGASAGGKGYTTNNCINLKGFSKSPGKVFLEFEGPINMRKENYSINSTINSKGKIERHLEYEGANLITKTINLQLETTYNGDILSFRVCFIERNGNPDCGGFSPYGGSVRKLDN